jgi:hypothetical protein
MGHSTRHRAANCKIDIDFHRASTPLRIFLPLYIPSAMIYVLAHVFQDEVQPTGHS